MEGGGGSTDTRPGFVPVQVVGKEGHAADVESTKEARMPTQVTQEAEKSTLEHVVESTKEARKPIQVTAKVKKDRFKNKRTQKTACITCTTVKAKEFVRDDKDARQPAQAASEAEKSFANVSELKNMKEKPVQESKNPNRSISGTSAMGDEFTKVAPVQESEQPKAKKNELKENPERSVRQVFQEGDLKELAKVRQESEDPTNKDSKVEIEDQRDGKGEQPLQETHGPGKVQRTEAEDTSQVKEGGREAHE